MNNEIVGLTGGIASGKTTIVNFLKKKKFAVHDSDTVVKNIYSKPPPSFIKYLKKIKLGGALNGLKINKAVIREEIFNNPNKKRKLEKYIHKEVKKSRDRFIKKHKKSKIVLLDIPLLFENKLEKICDYTILFFAPLKIRKLRALRRRGMNKIILEKIIKSQLRDTIKKRKADFIINTATKKNNTINKISKIINFINS